MQDKIIFKNKIEDSISNFAKRVSWQKKQSFIKLHYSKNEFSSLDHTRTPTYNRFIELLQRVSLSIAADIQLKYKQGNIVEIGAAEGWTSVSFAEVAEQYKKKLYVIDPYNGSECGSELVYNNFLESISKYSNIEHLRAKSTDESAIDFLKNAKPSFIYLDGLHSGMTPIRDLENCYEALDHGGLIAVDDTDNLRSVVGKKFKDMCDEKAFEMLDIKWYNLQDEKTWHFAIKK